MSKKSKNKSKEAYGSPVKRSEYNDEILRDNQRTGNRLKIDMHYYDRAQKVIMKDLGKESLLLQNKLESDRKTLSLGLYGSKFGVSVNRSTPRYTPTSPLGSVSSYKPPMRATSRTDARFPWDKDTSDKASTVIDKESTVSNNTSPRLKNSSKFRTPLSSAYPTSRAPTDDFLASILNEAMNDEQSYTHYTEERSPYKMETPKTPRSTRKKSKTPRSRYTPSDSIVNALANAAQTESDEVIY